MVWEAVDQRPSARVKHPHRADFLLRIADVLIRPLELRDCDSAKQLSRSEESALTGNAETALLKRGLLCTSSGLSTQQSSVFSVIAYILAVIIDKYTL